MQGWAKEAKKKFGKCIIIETEHNFSVLDTDGEPLVTAGRNGFGQMVDTQKDSKAKYPLNAVTDPAFEESHLEEYPDAIWANGHLSIMGSDGKPKPIYDKNGALIPNESKKSEK